MSSLSFAKAFGREKPHSSITDWVEILTGPSIAEEAYDGIPELIESINLQPAGPLEASRALRKKLKHGNPHQQYRALVLLKALVENCGEKFLPAFSDGHLTDALRLIGSEVTVDKRVKKKLLLVLSSWKEQYASDPSMSLIAGLYKQCRISERREKERYNLMGLTHETDRKAQEKEEKRLAKEKARLEEEERRKNKNKPKRVPFNFERDKPKVVESISEASQASSNLLNAIRLVNLDKETLQENERVQDCLTKAKQVRKTLVRYIQLVENEELIGTLIETNERIVNALEMYDQLTATDQGNPDPTAGLADRMASATIGGEVSKLQEKQRAAVQKSRDGTLEDDDSSPERAPVHVHPDLEDLDFGALGASSSRLPPPMRPKRVEDDEDEDLEERRGSLSDFSDYESSDEETHKARAGTSKRRDYVTVSDDEEITGFAKASTAEEDPFADPFADSAAVKRN